MFLLNSPVSLLQIGYYKFHFIWFKTIFFKFWWWILKRDNLSHCKVLTKAFSRKSFLETVNLSFSSPKTLLSDHAFSCFSIFQDCLLSTLIFVFLVNGLFHPSSYLKEAYSITQVNCMNQSYREKKYLKQKQFQIKSFVSFIVANTFNLFKLNSI